MDEDTGEILGRAAYRLTEVEFIAAYRAEKIAQSRDYDSRSSRMWLIGASHLLILLAFAMLFQHVGRGEATWPVVAFDVSLAVLGAWIADNWLYGYRRRYRRLYRREPLAGLDVAMTITPNRLFTHTEDWDTAADWSLFGTVLEFRDGFLLPIQPRGAIWIPSHALSPSLDAEALAAFLRSKAKKYRVIDRHARPAEEE